MSLFPKIQSPCPYVDRLASIMDGDQCRMCNRQVSDLTHMSGEDRKAFLASCSGEVCVSYSLPIRRALAAAALASAIPMAAAAQDVIDTSVETSVTAEEAESVEDVIILAGGIKDPRNVEFGEDPADLAIPTLPTVYDTESDEPKPAATLASSTPTR